MDRQLQHLLCGTFLHDIGKVMQRAEVLVTEETKNFMAQAGPSFNGTSSHFHVQWTSEFMENHKLNFFLDPDIPFDDHCSQLAFKHHNPSTPLQQIVAEADRLSSGMDRGETNYEKGIHKKKRMASLLSLMTFDKSPDDPVPQLPLKPLTSVDDSIYPQTFDSDTNLVPEYQDLWNQFQQDWIENPYRSFESTLAYLDSLYERYFWCVPANTTELIPDSSLYEHSKVSAALAAVLYQYHQAMQTFTVSDIKNKEIPKFLLLVGDLSGIQKFIFQISHLGGGKVAKQLRARSFLLEMIVQIISRKILCKLDLPFFNMIRNAGGKFYLLLPNLPESHQVIDDLSRESQEWLHRNFYGDISLNIAAIPLCGNDFFNKKIGKKFEELSDRLLWAKYSPLKRFLSDGEGWLEDNFIVEDALIQEEAASGIYETPSPIDDEKLGTELARTKCLAIYADRRGDHPILDWSFSVRSSVEEYDPNAHCLLSFKRGKERSYSDKNIPVHYEYKATYVPTYESTVFPEIDEFQQTHPEEILFPGQVLPFTAMAQIASGPKYVASHKFEHVSVIPA